MIPGEYFLSDEPIIANAEKITITLDVQNTGDRPIQVGSHAHFFEVNKALEFPRKNLMDFILIFLQELLYDSSLVIVKK